MPCCPADQLCDRCYALELGLKRPQARVIGEVWAERVARLPTHRAQAAWPTDDRARAIARTKVAQLASDRRLAAELVEDCLAGAAAWWQRRPARYR